MLNKEIPLVIYHTNEKCMKKRIQPFDITGENLNKTLIGSLCFNDYRLIYDFNNLIPLNTPYLVALVQIFNT